MKKTNKKAPEIRFPEFTDDWEQRKLGEIAPLRGGFAFKSNEYANEGVPIIRISNILSDGSIGADFACYDEQEPDDTFSLYDGAALLAMSGATTGKVSVLHAEKGQKYYQNQRVGYFTPTENCDYKFIRCIVKSQLFIDQLASVLVAGAQPNVSSKEIDSFEFMIPKSKDEQHRIGECIESLDHLITLHQRKCDKIKELKSCMLQKMFPRKGDTKPEIRFPEFTDDWEQRKLEDVTSEFKSGSFIAAAEIEETGEYPVYGGNGLRGYSETYNHDGEFALIGRQGALCGNMNYSTGKAYFTEHAVAVKANDLANTKFLYYLLDKMNLGQYSDQSAQPGLAVGKIIKLKNMFPSKEEQDRIGDYFTNFDHLITLHQRKCDVLKKMKKGMLQKMFV